MPTEEPIPNKGIIFPESKLAHQILALHALNDYASGTRATGPNGIMQTIAKRLSTEDIRNLASYLQGIR